MGSHLKTSSIFKAVIAFATTGPLILNIYYTFASGRERLWFITKMEQLLVRK